MLLKREEQADARIQVVHLRSTAALTEHVRTEKALCSAESTHIGLHNDRGALEGTSNWGRQRAKGTPVQMASDAVDSSVDNRPQNDHKYPDTHFLELNFYLDNRRFASPNALSTTSYPLTVHNAVDDR